MKKTSKRRLIRLGIIVGSFGAVIALLEAFDLHPQFSVGRFHSIWVGVRHMDFASETTTVPTPRGEKVIEKDYDIGPFMIAIEI